MSDFSGHYGHWGLVAIMVVIASGLLYRYAAPRSWRDWSGAGLVQAFIIALYAEMYGFPLTIYLLTGFFGIDLPLTSYSGHLWATLLGYGEVGAIIEMLLGLVFVFFGIALLAVGWRQVYQARHHVLPAEWAVAWASGRNGFACWRATSETLSKLSRKRG
ncbi:MAG: hypothetical protein ACREQ7_10970 [Candidatus Binatia bacterium]